MKHYEMERVAQMKEVIGEKTDSLTNSRLEKLEKLLIDSVDSIRNDLEIALKELASDKTDGNLVISFLRSSNILKNYEFYIAYYDGEPWRTFLCIPTWNERDALFIQNI